MLDEREYTTMNDAQRIELYRGLTKTLDAYGIALTLREKKFVLTAIDEYDKIKSKDAEGKKKAPSQDLPLHSPIPAPEEPVGLGAVVKVEGDLYIRTSNGSFDGETYTWYSQRNGNFQPWKNMVRFRDLQILSTGVIVDD